jgi:hypothetical protein
MKQTILKSWLLKLSTKQEHKQLSKAISDISKQKLLSKTLALWLQKLGLKLKSKHLKSQVSYTFNKKIAPRKFFNSWRSLSIKQLD